MSEAPVVIRASNLGKRYARVHEKPMLLRHIVTFAAGGKKRRVDEFWALRNVSFEIQKGETLGVLGPNGSGKTTLLSLVAGTSFPNEGSISTRGRVSLLLALGAGFNPDMTGEENIMVNAGLLGIAVPEARRRMSQIVDFAELAEFIDTPVRSYSSGMLARLGFSIAINVSPDILVVDEVISVGDIKFQQKCKDEFLRLQSVGTTIVLVSQTPGTIQELCGRALWLEQGSIRQQGSGGEVASAYKEAMGQA